MVAISKAGRVTVCKRCKAPCRVATEKNPEARFLRRSLKPQGLCVNCATTQFLKSIESLESSIQKHGLESLLNPMFQKQFQKVMISGGADASFDEINWDVVIKNWDLPFKQGR